jgi:hypothetical protein
MKTAGGRRILLMCSYLLLALEDRNECAAGRIDQGVQVDVGFDMNARSTLMVIRTLAAHNYIMPI